MQNNMFYRIGIVIALAILSCHLNAQVRIGGTAEPAKGATLDLNTTESNGFKGALAPPVIALPDTIYIPEVFTDFAGKTNEERDNAPALSGLLVYNTTENQNAGLTSGLYYWDGTKWNPFGCLDLSGRTTFVCGDFVTDIENNSYKTQSEGSNCWMRDGLIVRKDNEGNSLDVYDWNGDPGNYYMDWEGFYGYPEYVYSHSVMESVCPDGWRLPTEAEWLARANGDMSDLNNPADWGYYAEEMKDYFNLDLPEGEYAFSLFWFQGAEEYEAIIFIPNYTEQGVFLKKVSTLNYWRSGDGVAYDLGFASIRCVKDNQ